MTESFFFVDQRNETVGPVSWEVLLQLENAGAVSPETPAAPEGGSDWVAFSELKARAEAKAKLPPVPGSGLSSPVEEVAAPTKQEEPQPGEVLKSVNVEVRSDPVGGSVRTEIIKWDLALLLLGLSTSLGISSDLASYVGKTRESEVFAGVGLVALIPAIIFCAVLHYQCWHALPVKYRVISPGKAVGFLFIPFFNLYWAFVSWVKLADGYEAWQHESGGGGQYSLKGLGITQAVFFCLPFLMLPALPLLMEFPIVSIILGFVSLMIFGLFYNKVVTAANQLMAGQFVIGPSSGRNAARWSAGTVLVVAFVSFRIIASIERKSIHPFFIAVVPLVLVFLLVLFLRRK